MPSQGPAATVGHQVAMDFFLETINNCSDLSALGELQLGMWGPAPVQHCHLPSTPPRGQPGARPPVAALHGPPFARGSPPGHHVAASAFTPSLRPGSSPVSGFHAGPLQHRGLPAPRHQRGFAWPALLPGASRCSHLARNGEIATQLPISKINQRKINPLSRRKEKKRQSVTYKHLLTFPSSYCRERSQRYFRLLIHLGRVSRFVLPTTPPPRLPSCFSGCNERKPRVSPRTASPARMLQGGPGCCAMSYRGFVWREAGAKSCLPVDQAQGMLSKGRLQQAALHPKGTGKARKNKTRKVSSAGKSHRELGRGVGSSLCNLGDGQKEPEAEGAQCQEHGCQAAAQRGLAKRGESPFPKPPFDKGEPDRGPRNRAHGGSRGA